MYGLLHIDARRHRCRRRIKFSDYNWDITGAMRAGWAGAFIARPGMILGPLDEQPDIVGPDLSAVTDRILEVER